MTFVRIMPGKFTMGSPQDEPGRSDDEKQHQVTLTKEYYMQTTEVTVGQWRAFAKATGYKTEAEKEGGAYVYANGYWDYQKGYHWDNPGFTQDENHPVTCVSWNDAISFIKWLNSKGKAVYRLPSEAEWEYAARAGTITPFSFGKCLSTNQANYDGNYPLKGCPKGKFRKKTVKATSFKPNAWGLYNMHGNVYEWCNDRYDDYQTGSITDPVGPKAGSYRVFRGGGWVSNAENCRSAYRSRSVPGHRYGHVGVRLLRQP